MIIDLVGQKFSRLTVLSYACSKSGKAHWNCLCDCGTETVVMGYYLRCRHTQSCGCLNRDRLLERNKGNEFGMSHGVYRSVEYVAYINMKQRVLNPNGPRYEHYGGRGIFICDKWLHNPSIFLADMGVRPGSDYELDRIDNDGDYEPENCQWLHRDDHKEKSWRERQK